MDFNTRNFHPRDLLLTFDAESHTYYHNGTPFKSVTTLVEECFPRFDAVYWANRKAAQEGVTPQELLDRWEKNACHARNLGTAMHEKIEHYYLGEDAGDDADAFSLFRLFAADHTLHPYRTEWRIFIEEYGIAGTLDFLELTPDGTFNIYDWKRSQKLISPSGEIEIQSRFHKTALYPISHLDDTSYYHYALQLSIYRYILETKYDIRVSAMRLGVFHPSYSTYYIVDVPYLRDEVITVLGSKALKNPKNTDAAVTFH